MKIETQAILPHIDSPADIRKLTMEELAKLAYEIRKFIVKTVSRNGGHLAPSLGTVELTLALHYVFDTPIDKIIWDVGHQAYAHKIITGRRDRFHTLRRKGGISGFPRREESSYDVFNVGHSSTSISVAAGMVEARRLSGENYKVVAVIGDGSLTAGMALEAVNWTGDRDEDLIIILNDNEMSISSNVGAISSYLNRIMTGQHMMKWRSDLKRLLNNIPGIGGSLLHFTRYVEETLKGFILPGLLFEEMGYKYVGPLEGHRLDHLIRNLKNVRDMKGPVLVHVITRKGKGYAPAEKQPSKFHGIGPFNIVSGEPLSDKDAPPSYTEVFGRTVLSLARKNPKIVAITAAMCQGTGLEEFSQELPDRFYDVGIAEQHGVTFAAGLAAQGFTPVVAIYSTFLQRAYDQVLHDVCLQNLPVVLALDRGGFVGDDGPTHHGLFDFSYLRSMPNMIVMAPKDENELQHMLLTALECGLPVSVRYPRGRGIGMVMDEAPTALEIGKAETVRPGRDLAVLAIGSTVYPAMQAADDLSGEGIDVEVINCRFVKPLDDALLCDAAMKLGKVLTVEENVLMGGFGSAVMELFEMKGLTNIRVKRLGIGDEFVQHAAQTELRQLYGIDAAGIVRAVREMLCTLPRQALGNP